MLSEELSSEKMRFTLELKDKAVQQAGLEADAEKLKREKAAEASALEQVIAARAQEEAMAHVLPFKVKEIEQRRLEAEANRVARVKQAEGEAEARRIEAGGEADSRRKLAEAEAFRIDATGKAQSAQLERDSALIAKNPLMIQKTIADKLSDKIQVIIAPPGAGGFFASGLVGQSPVAHPSPTLASCARPPRGDGVADAPRCPRRDGGHRRAGPDAAARRCSRERDATDDAHGGRLARGPR